MKFTPVFLFCFVVNTAAWAENEVIPPGVGPMEPTVLGGPTVDPKQFEAVRRIFFPGSGCTGTLVSNNVLITAGHCILRSQQGSFMMGNKRVRFSCVANPRYNPRNNHSLDMAACKLAEPVQLPAQATACVGEKASNGDTVSMFGYGETNGRRHDGRLRRGESTVRGRGRNGDIVTSGRSALGSGDSGGPLAKVKNGRFWLVGVNSKSDGVRSLFADASDPANRQFLQQFAQRNSVQICGITNQLNGSRDLAANGDAPIAPPSPDRPNGPNDGDNNLVPPSPERPGRPHAGCGGAGGGVRRVSFASSTH